MALWLGLLLAVAVSFIYHLDKKATAFLVVIFGFVTQAFSGLIAVIGLIPVAGPIIAKVLAWPLFFTLNGLAYLLTFMALGRGRKKQVIESRVLVTVFLVGVIVGFLLGRLF